MKLLDKLTQTKFYKFLLLHKKILLIVLIVVVIIGGIIKNNLSVNNMRQVSAESTKVSSSVMFRINVSGEVKKVRTLVFTKSVYLFEIIEMCGGFSDYADIEGLDLLKVYNSDCNITINKKVEKQDNKIYVVDLRNSNNTCYLIRRTSSDYIAKLPTGDHSSINNIPLSIKIIIIINFLYNINNDIFIFNQIFNIDLIIKK